MNRIRSSLLERPKCTIVLIVRDRNRFPLCCGYYTETEGAPIQQMELLVREAGERLRLDSEGRIRTVSFLLLEWWEENELR